MPQVRISDTALIIANLFENYNQAEQEIASALYEMEQARQKLRIAIDKRDLINAMALEVLSR